MPPPKVFVFQRVASHPSKSRFVRLKYTGEDGEDEEDDDTGSDDDSIVSLNALSVRLESLRVWKRHLFLSLSL